MLHAQTRCRSVHVRGFSAGQKTVENQDWAADRRVTGPSRAAGRRAWGPFLERPGNLTGPKSYFEIKISRKVGRVLTSNEVNFVSLADTFTVQFSNLLKLPRGMKNKTA